MEGGNFSSNSSGGPLIRRGRRSTRSLDFAVPYTAASGTFSFVGGVSNLFVIFILVKYVGMNQKTYMYMLSLFISDFIYNVIVQPQVCFYQFPSSTITLFGMYYIHGASLMCILTGSASFFFASLDKFVYINFPYFHVKHVTNNNTRVVILAIWLACLGLGIMRFYNIIFITDGYLMIIATLFLLTILVQFLIFVVARNQEKRLRQVERSLAYNHPQNGDGQSVAQERQNTISNKAARTIGLMLGVYIASWLPVNIYRFEYRWNGGNRTVYHKWIKIVNLLIQVHSCINPYIFVLRTKDMKVGIEKMMRNLGVHRLLKCLSDDRTATASRSSSAVPGNETTMTSSSSAVSKENISAVEDDEKGKNGSGSTRGEHINNGFVAEIQITNSEGKNAGAISGRDLCSPQNTKRKSVNSFDGMNSKAQTTGNAAQDNDGNIADEDNTLF